MICSKISSPAAHQDCVGSDSTTAQLHCITSVKLVSRTNVGRRLAREASSRCHATETRVHLPGACNVHTVLNNLVTFPVGTNDAEADQHISSTSREITGKLHNEGGTRTEQGSRRARPGLDSDQAACLH
ncbi:unnamed protein product [Polarella glacialis]|uniref:Uncharacterized protein n=1 Tax=Polarella glacialis TaxID=89957 RepID=A0A813L2Y1_POLGL|nr:unnamed protein product [Polarella glacialis]